MFQSLSEKLESIFRRLKDRGRLTEKEIDDSLREVRMALLEADVNYKVVKAFTTHVRGRALEAEVLQSLTPAQQVIRVVRDELASLLGGTRAELARASIPPTRIMMVGLQGSGKTTTCGKLARHLAENGFRPFLVPADLSRPAAVDQLLTVAGRAGVPAFRPALPSTAVEIYRAAAIEASRLGCDTLIVDTAGRLHVDDALMEEAAALAGVVHPHEILLVADAMTGQDAVTVAEAFAARLQLTGLILTKLDGDARGGAALSMRQVTGLPVKFAGVGEGLDGLEPFHPERVAARILGMGDVMTLIDRAERAAGEPQSEEAVARQLRGEFTLEDFREQLKQIRGMGSLSEILSMLPIPARFKKSVGGEMDEGEIVRVSAIIDSMTPQERRQPRIINGSRRKRISAGSGTTVTDINRLLKQFEDARKMMKTMGKRGMKGKWPLS